MQHRPQFKKESSQMVFGIRAVMEAIRSGKEIEALYVQRGLGGELFQELKTVLAEYQVTAQQVPVEKLNRITSKNHQGIIAVISEITYQKIEGPDPADLRKGRSAADFDFRQHYGCAQHGCHRPHGRMCWCSGNCNSDKRFGTN